jgi:hypothetical protein
MSDNVQDIKLCDFGFAMKTDRIPEGYVGGTDK